MTYIFPFLLHCALALFGQTPAGAPDPHLLKELQPAPLDAESGGTASMDLPGGEQGRNYLLIVGAPSGGEQSRVVHIERSITAHAQPLHLVAATEDAAWRRRVEEARAKMAARRIRKQPEAFSTVGKFAPRRGFHLFVKEGSFQDLGNYQQVAAELVAVGKHCLIYVDAADDPAHFAPAVVDEVVHTFDETVFPRAGVLFGSHRDVDRNGKFTILFSHWLGDLSGGKVAIGGFVRGGDFYRDVDAPYSNQCDMLYLNTSLKAGAHLRTLVAHEYTHAITFCEHVFGEYLPGEFGLDEEGWLNEAISHLAENLYGDGWSNLDYRVSTYLTAPGHYRLVVPDYYRAGLFRDHGCRGATYLFLRWCVDRHGEGLLKELTQSGLVGVDNLEAATQRPFAELFRHWSLAVSLQGCGGGPANDSLKTVKLHDRLGNYLLAGPRPQTIEPGGNRLTLAATSFVPTRICVSPGETAHLSVESSDDASLQLTLVRLPDDAAQADLEIAPPVSSRGRGAQPAKAKHSSPTQQFSIRVRQQAGRAVRWERLSWEPEFLPAVKESDEMPRPTLIPAEEIFARAATKAGETIISDPLDPPAAIDGSVVFKLAGRDSLGRPVSAWGSLDRRRLARASDVPERR